MLRADHWEATAPRRSPPRAAARGPPLPHWSARRLTIRNTARRRVPGGATKMLWLETAVAANPGSLSMAGATARCGATDSASSTPWQANSRQSTAGHRGIQCAVEDPRGAGVGCRAGAGTGSRIGSSALASHTSVSCARSGLVWRGVSPLSLDRQDRMSAAGLVGPRSSPRIPCAFPRLGEACRVTEGIGWTWRRPGLALLGAASLPPTGLRWQRSQRFASRATFATPRRSRGLCCSVAAPQIRCYARSRSGARATRSNPRHV